MKLHMPDHAKCIDALFVGDGGVGKTSVFRTILGRQVKVVCTSTDNIPHKATVEAMEGGLFNFRFLDTCGQEGVQPE